MLDSEFDARIVRSKTSLNSFKSVYSQEPLVQGDRYYFEIKFLKGCNFKIGVCKNKNVKENAFCDETDGYGYYSAGQLRNGSKTSGMKYGETYRGNKDQDVIGVYVDLIDGKLFYSKNKEIFKIAFSGPELLKDDFYAACCCLT